MRSAFSETDLRPSLKALLVAAARRASSRVARTSLSNALYGVRKHARYVYAKFNVYAVTIAISQFLDRVAFCAMGPAMWPQRCELAPTP